MNLAIDLDGTLAVWQDGGPTGAGEEQVGGWLPGAEDALDELFDAGHKLVVHSCRCTWADGGGWEAVASFLAAGGFVPWLVSGNGGQERWQPVYLSESGGWFADEPIAWEPGLGVGIWVGEGKPVAHWYIDDRAVEFKGDWPVTVFRLKTKEKFP